VEANAVEADAVEADAVAMYVFPPTTRY